MNNTERYKREVLSGFMQDDFASLLRFLKKCIDNNEIERELAETPFSNWTIENLISYWEAHGSEVNSGFTL
jgi:hypothetical protein